LSPQLDPGGKGRRGALHGAGPLWPVPDDAAGYPGGAATRSPCRPARARWHPADPRRRPGLTPVPRAGRLPTVDAMTGMEARDADLKKELNATLQARRELGEEYESALVDAFLEKVDQRIDGAVERRVRRQLAEHRMTAARDSRAPGATDS